MSSRLRDLATSIERGITPKYVHESPYVVVNQKAIRWGRIDYSAVKYLDPSEISRVPLRKYLRQNDVVLNSTGDVTIGRAYVFRERVENHLPDSHVTTIRLRPDSLDPYLLVQLLSLPQFQREIYAITSGSTGQLELGRDAVGGIIVPVPPPGEQNRMASLLSSVDAATEKTEAAATRIDQLRRVLLRELLTCGVPGWHGEWKPVPGIGLLPACWDVVRLSDVADVQTGRAVGKQRSSGELRTLPYLSVANVKDGHLDLTVVKTMQVSKAEAERFALTRGDVLFTEGGDADKLGRGCVWNAELDPCLHQNHVFAVRPRDGRLRSGFLAAYAYSARGKAYFLSCAKQTTNLASINSTQLKAFPLPLPSPVEQDAIIAALDAVRSRALATAGSLAALRHVKGVLADGLLSGRVRVPAAADRTV